MVVALSQLKRIGSLYCSSSVNFDTLKNETGLFLKNSLMLLLRTIVAYEFYWPELRKLDLLQLQE